MKQTALLPMVVFWAGLAVSAAAAEKEVIPIQVRKDLQLVYQVTDDLVYEGVNKGLFYTKKLIDTYERQGINLTDVNMHVVYHGTGLAALVNDGARDRLRCADCCRGSVGDRILELRAVHFEYGELLDGGHGQHGSPEQVRHLPSGFCHQWLR